MAIESYLQISESSRAKFIEENILNKLKESKDPAKQIINSIAAKYAGRDEDVLILLSYAVEKTRLKEYIDKLEKQYNENMHQVYPKYRNRIYVKGVQEFERFLAECYRELGVSPNK